MRHLHLVPGTSHDPPQPASAGSDGPPRTVLAISPGPVEPDPGDTSTDAGLGLPEPSPELAVAFAEVDALLDGLTPAQRMDAARTLYHDSDGQLQARSLNLRLT